MRAPRIGFAVAIMFVLACGDDGAPADAGADAAADAPVVVADAPVDSVADAAADAPGEVDAPVDASVDALVDAAVDASPDAAADAAVDASPDAAADAAVDASPDAAIDAAVDAGTAFEVDTVLVDGATVLEVRQASTVELTLRGDGLAAVDSVRAGALVATVTSATDGELRATLVVPHAAALGAVALTVGAGAITAVPASLIVTPFVVAADGSDAGRGTFAAPLRLCTPGLTALMAAGDTLHLRQGAHRCDGALAIPRGASVRGEGAAATTVAGNATTFTGFVVDGPAGTTRLRDVTLSTGGAAPALRVLAGGVVVADIALIVSNPAAAGITLEATGASTIDRLAVQGGLVGVLVKAGATAQVADIVIAAATTGIQVDAGRVEGRAVTVTGGQSGVVASDIPDSDDPSAVAISLADLHVSSTRDGVRHRDGVVELTRPVLVGDGIRAITTRTGISSVAGALTVTGGRIVEWERAVLAAATGRQASEVTLDGVEVAGMYGIDVVNEFSQLHLRVRNSLASGLVGGVHISETEGGSILDLGTAADPGNNRFTSQGAAVNDQRGGPSIPLVPIDLRGTTLNGRTYTGTVMGPVRVFPDYWIRWENVIRF
jgi:hypothetical protein